MNLFERLLSWWWDLRNGSMGDEWSSSYPSMPDDLECPDTQPTSPGALDSDLGRLP